MEDNNYVTRRQLFGYAATAATPIAGGAGYLYLQGEDAADSLLRLETTINFILKKTNLDMDKIPSEVIEAEARYWHWFKEVHWGEAINTPEPGGVLICKWVLPRRPIAREIHLPVIIGMTDNNYYATATPQIFIPEDSDIVGKPRNRYRSDHYDRRTWEGVGKEGIQLPRTIPPGDYKLIYTYIFEEAVGPYPELLNGRIQPDQHVIFTVKDK